MKLFIVNKLVERTGFRQLTINLESNQDGLPVLDYLFIYLLILTKFLRHYNQPKEKSCTNYPHFLFTFFQFGTDLLKAFCECYDMKPHATNIFQDIVNALGAYVQSLFVASQVNTPAGKLDLSKTYFQPKLLQPKQRLIFVYSLEIVLLCILTYNYEIIGIVLVLY